MTLVKSSAVVIGLSLVFLLASSCKNGGGGGSGGTQNPAGDNSDAVGWRGSKACTVNSDCAGSTQVLCTVFQTPALCDKSVPGAFRCMVKLGTSPTGTPYQCAEGHARPVTLADNAPGIITCNTSTCDWTAGQACGAAGQPCCVGGCAAPKTCSSLIGATGSTCN